MSSSFGKTARRSGAAPNGISRVITLVKPIPNQATVGSATSFKNKPTVTLSSFNKNRQTGTGTGMRSHASATRKTEHRYHSKGFYRY